MSFYYFVTTKAKDLATMAIGDRGTVRHTPQGEVCVVRSLADAQRLARVFREAGLLS
jgi:hypothetical protein